MNWSTYYRGVVNHPQLKIIHHLMVTHLDIIKIVALILALLISFLVGRKRQDNSLQKSINKLNSTQYFKKELNEDLLKTKQHLKSTKKMLKVVLVICVLCLLFFVASMSKLLSPVLPSNLSLYFLGFFVCLYLVIFLVNKYLERRQKMQTSYLANIYNEQNKEVEKVLKEIGPKLTNRIKTTLETQEKEKYEMDKKKDCDLHSCNETKKLINQAQDIFVQTMKEMAKFKWCDWCEKYAEKANEKPFHQFDLNYLKRQGLSLDDMKRRFNKLLEIYQIKKEQFNKVCTQECSKGYCKMMKEISQKYYQKMAPIDRRLQQLKKL